MKGDDMMNEYTSDKPILPVCLCISTNTAMENDVYAGPLSDEGPMSRIDIVTMGIQSLFDSGLDQTKPYRLAVSILIFDNSVSQVQDFVLLDGSRRTAPVIEPDKPYTAVGEVMLQAMKLIRDYETACDQRGEAHLPAVMMMLYAGRRNNGTPENFSKAQTVWQQMTARGMKSVMLAITPSADLDVLRTAAPQARIERVEIYQLPNLMPALVHALGAEQKERPAPKQTPPEAERTADPTEYIMDIWNL